MIFCVGMSLVIEFFPRFPVNVKEFALEIPYRDRRFAARRPLTFASRKTRGCDDARKRGCRQFFEFKKFFHFCLLIIFSFLQFLSLILKINFVSLLRKNNLNLFSNIVIISPFPEFVNTLFKNFTIEFFR